MKTVALKTVCSVIMGQAPPGSSYNNDGVGLPLIAGAGDFGELTPKPSRHTTASSRYSQKGDIILCIRATIGDRNWSDGEYCLGRGVAGLRPHSGLLDSGYLWHWIGISAEVMRQRARGSTFKQISKDAIETLKIPLPLKPDGTPDLDEQRRIAAILDKADEMRRKRREAIRLTEELLRSAFLDMFGDPVTNPKGWPRERIGNLANIITGSTPPSKKSGMFGGEIPFVTPGDLESGRSASRYVTKEGAKNSRMARKGATLVCCIGATIGKTDMALFQVAFNQQINAVEWGKEIVDEYGFLCLSYGRNSVINAAIKTTLPIIKKSLFSDIRIPVPPLDEQREFAKFFQKRSLYHKRLFSMKKETDNLFNVLVQRAFKGEL